MGRSIEGAIPFCVLVEEKGSASLIGGMGKLAWSASFS